MLVSVSGLKDEKLIRKQTCLKTETCKESFEYFWKNIIKIEPYISELYRFKIGAFWDTCISQQLYVPLFEFIEHLVTTTYKSVTHMAPTTNCGYCTRWSYLPYEIS